MEVTRTDTVDENKHQSFTYSDFPLSGCGFRSLTFSTSVGIWAPKLMWRRQLPGDCESEKGDQFSMLKDTSHQQAEFITSALMILSGSFKLETRRKVNENEWRYNPKTLQTSSAGRQQYISFKGSLCGKEEDFQWQTYYLSLLKVKASRSIEIRIGKEGISTRAWVFIISETVIDDQCHYEWWGPTLVIQNASKRWEWLSFPLKIASFP